MSGATPLGPGREFDAVRSLLRRWGDRAAGIGDDAALLDVPSGARLVVSTDTSVEGVHFRREWLRPEEIGWRATMAALSDLAAMGARPLGVLAAIAVPPRWRELLDSLGDGVGEAAAAAGAPIVGGDLTGAGELSICVTVLGAAERPLSRRGARPGDAIYVTGRLGGPRAAVTAWQRGETPRADCRERFARPVARIREGVWLAAHGATAAVDVSDGLLADLAHVAAASGAALELDLDALPLLDGIDAAEGARGGEEYELALAAPDDLDTARFSRELGTPIARIGWVRAGAPSVSATLRGVRVAAGGGWDHFS
jgi:thiamine-monophosphate kinase